MRMTMQWTLWMAAAVLGVSSAACSGSVQVTGRVTGLDGTPRGAATTVRASLVSPDGTLTPVAEANIGPQGGYKLEVPAGEERLAIQALDDSGDVVVSALLGSTGNSAAAIAAPRRSETSRGMATLAGLETDSTTQANDPTFDVCDHNTDICVCGNASVEADVNGTVDIEPDVGIDIDDNGRCSP